jgi:hypothetical protein
LAPHSFDFDDLRLYVKWKDDTTLKPTGLAGVVFEVQIKTFLQHAWGIATHDFVYKSDEVHWSMNRIAYQVKAMLENAELSISAATKLPDSSMLCKTDRSVADLRFVIAELKARWEPALLPADLRRLALNLTELSKALRISLPEIWDAVDKATADGQGAKTLNLSPYGATMSALIREHGGGIFDPLAHPKCRDVLFVPWEIELPAIADGAEKHIVRPPIR